MLFFRFLIIRSTMIPLFLFLHLISHAITKTSGAKLVFVQTMLRHGQKYPDHSLNPHIEHSYLQSHIPFGQLTNAGRAMHYLVGKKMYQIYWEQLFGGTYDQYHLHTSKITAKSINYSRIIKSAEAHLFGMLQGLPPLTISQNQVRNLVAPFPDIKVKPGKFDIIVGYVFGDKGRGYQTIPIHIVQSCKFSSYVHRQEIINLNLKNDIALKIKNYPPFQAAFHEFAKSINVTNGIGIPVTFGHLHRYYMNEVCQIALGKNSIVFQNSQTTRALNTVHILQIHAKFYINQAQMKVDTTPFFQQLIQNVNRYIKNRSSSQWVVFSGQQISMGMILAALKLWSVDCIFQNYVKNITNPGDCIMDLPPFASVLAFEIYQYPNQTHTFKINYNGKYLKVPLCNLHEQCEFSKLENWFHAWKVPDQFSGCLGTNQYIKKLMKSTTNHHHHHHH